MGLFSGNRASDSSAGRIAELEAMNAAIHRSQAVVEFDLDGTVLTANDNFLKTMGYSLADIKGRKHSMFVPAALDQITATVRRSAEGAKQANAAAVRAKPAGNADWQEV